MSTLHAYLDVCYGTNFKDTFSHSHIGQNKRRPIFHIVAVSISICCICVPQRFLISSFLAIVMTLYVRFLNIFCFLF